MKKPVQKIVLLLIALLVPAIPLVVLGFAFEERLVEWVEQLGRSEPWVVAGVVVAVLAIDILLPIPSSVICALAGNELGVFWGTMVAWLGLNLACIIGYWSARLVGKSLFGRLVDTDDEQAGIAFINRFGDWALALSRPVPILAEAVVLLCGMQSYPWSRFAVISLVANLAIAISFVALGKLSGQFGMLPLGLVIAICVPLILLLGYKRKMAEMNEGIDED